MSIIQPFGRTLKRITLKIDERGNINIEALDNREMLRLPGQPERPLPLTPIETLYWLTKSASDVLALMIQKGGKQTAPAGGQNETTKTD